MGLQNLTPNSVLEHSNNSLNNFEHRIMSSPLQLVTQKAGHSLKHNDGDGGSVNTCGPSKSCNMSHKERNGAAQLI